MKKEEKIKNDNFLDSLTNACEGINYSIKTQISIKIQLAVTLIVLILSIYFKLTKVEFLFIISAIFMVIVAETINTAIETTVDLVTTKYHPKDKIAKDVAAGAVLISAIYAIVVGVIVFYDKFIQILNI